MEKGTVKIGIDYLDVLIRDSEKLRVLEDMYERNDYVLEKDVRIVLGLPARKDGE